MHRWYKYIVSILLLFVVHNSYSQQTVEALQQEIARAQQEIEKSKKLLSLSRDKEKDEITKLNLTQANIRNRRTIVNNLDKQLRIVNNDIYGNNRTISKLSTELTSLKADYTKSVVNRYKDIKQSNFLLFLFSSATFYDIYTRNEYLERIASFTMAKSINIEKTSSELDKENDKLNKKNIEITELKASRSRELAELTKEENEYKSLLASIKKEQESIDSDIRKRTNQIAQLQNRIQQLIEDEVGKGKGESSERVIAELALLSKNFDDNKGRLPSPIRGVITSHFGLNSDPIQKNLKVKNNGVNIAASERNIRSIFSGEVVKVFFFQGLNNSVMIRHGKYISVYSNMSNVKVEVGDTVKPGETIGTVSDGDNQTVHFELWQETTPLNPEQWIKFN